VCSVGAEGPIVRAERARTADDLSLQRLRQTRPDSIQTTNTSAAFVGVYIENRIGGVRKALYVLVCMYVRTHNVLIQAT
jgi:hypothetical protein